VAVSLPPPDFEVVHTLTIQKIDGNRALAWGALEAGVSLVTGYPGSPATGTFQTLLETTYLYGHIAEWCLNERIALDMAAGASQGGQRALVCVKSVGMNVALDTLMTLNLTGVHAGLVILVGDDPGARGSQNEQDSRLLAPLTELPLLEPATPAEGRRMMRWAFDFSETLQTVVIIRITRGFSEYQEHMVSLAPPENRPVLPPNRESMRWIAIPSTAVEQHRRLHQKLEQATAQFSHLPFNRIEGSGSKGILAGGFAYTKLRQILAGADTSALSILKLSAVYPLPYDLVAGFLKSCEEVLVFEEVDPYLEDALKTVGYDLGVAPKILGKRTGHVNWEGELDHRHIQHALVTCLPDFSPVQPKFKTDSEKVKPVRRKQCEECPYVEILTIFREEAAALNQSPFLTGDPGCLVTAAHLLDIKLSMGSAIGIAAGLTKAGVSEPVVAVFGDSAFYHGGLNALIQARATRTNLLTLVLDNGGAVTTGGQPTPDRGLDLPEGKGPVVSIRTLAETCGVESIWEIGVDGRETQMRAIFRQALLSEGLNMVIIRVQCQGD
jgi:indolepyruvate ferredoxin oxidoreductase alpha subunit